MSMSDVGDRSPLLRAHGYAVWHSASRSHLGDTAVHFKVQMTLYPGSIRIFKQIGAFFDADPLGRPRGTFVQPPLGSPLQKYCARARACGRVR